ncbi:hypothetical protein [Acinetobacter baumannii]|uniref:Lipoprotein n=2 Tax=Acinetobacter baumannii TaxID=470 RepID=A0A7X1SHT4_ACIBA|nr:hypothetical protein [Acinetobacter baumannii]ALJ88083.1 hypothetical protein AN415_02178 [Acinetobacter baumannii]EGJ61156.1 hypothetical protein HMPREF0021_01311 [Acinetobacter baumannii 6013150]EGJ66103.1 hypothetical protein HMPREF0020_00196 [Acinetobacter baumannii 6013113]EHU1795827.1 hypothetical protein [Acinetobacter baumannii]EHU2742833.1 hypothetical protein [Acinetobacter baumannii]
MNLKLTFAALLIVPMMLTACAKKEEATQAGQDAASTAVADKVTPEQQAAIDALDKPVLDEKNTDVVEGSTASESAASETY